MSAIPASFARSALNLPSLARLPPLWLCPRLLNAPRTYTTSHVLRENLPGRLKRSKRRDTKQRFEKLRNQPTGQSPTSFHEPELLSDLAASHLSSLHEALEQRDVFTAVQILASGEQAKLVPGRDITDLTRLLHHLIRSNKIQKSNAQKVINQLAQLYRRRLIEGHPRTTWHLLCCFRDANDLEGAVDFWRWARAQKTSEEIEYQARTGGKRRPMSDVPSYTDIRVYGIAIEILAKNGQDISACEEVYAEALQRFSRDFNGYHLQTGAALTNPDEMTNSGGTSLTLIGGMVFARLIHGDWRRAYLALDTAFRLHPTQMTDALMYYFSSHRPLSECLSVLCMYLRGENKVNNAFLVSVLTDVMHWLKTLPDLIGRVQLFILALNMLRMSRSNHGQVGTIHMNVLLSGAVELVPAADDCSSKVFGEVDDICAMILEMFIEIGIRADEQTLSIVSRRENGEMNMAGLVRFLPESVQNSIAVSKVPTDTEAADLDAHQQEFIQKWEQHIRRISTMNLEGSESAAMTASDWQLLVKGLATLTVLQTSASTSVEGSTQLFDGESFLDQQMNMLGTSSGDKATIVEMYQQQTAKYQKLRNIKRAVENESGATVDDEELDTIAILKEVKLDLGAGLDLETAIDVSPSPWLAVMGVEPVPDSWQKELYEKTVLLKNGLGQDSEVATSSPNDHSIDATETENSLSNSEELEQPATDTASTAATNIQTNALDQLSLSSIRYRNWCAINTLLLEAEAFEEMYAKRADEAVTGKKPWTDLRNLQRSQNVQQTLNTSYTNKKKLKRRRNQAVIDQLGIFDEAMSKVAERMGVGMGEKGEGGGGKEWKGEGEGGKEGRKERWQRKIMELRADDMLE